MLLRVTIFRGTVFLKGAAWSLFLIVPFSGRLRIYYEGMRQGLRLCIPFYLAQEISVTYPWIRMIYMLGVITLLIRLVRSMKRVRELIKRSSVPYVADYGRRTVFRERI